MEKNFSVEYPHCTSGRDLFTTDMIMLHCVQNENKPVAPFTNMV